MCQVMRASPAPALADPGALQRAPVVATGIPITSGDVVVVSRITLRWLRLKLGAPLLVLAAPTR